MVNDDTIPNNSVNNDNSQDASSPDHQAENHHNDAKISSGNGSNSETETATEETSNGPIKVRITQCLKIAQKVAFKNATRVEYFLTFVNICDFRLRMNPWRTVTQNPKKRQQMT